MKQHLKNIPIIGSLFVKLKRSISFQESFTTSESYWIERYNDGGNSGAGSYNVLAQFKGDVLNKFVSNNKIKTVIELGCGDGNQLKYFKFPSYTGFDISQTVIELCKAKYRTDKTKQFLHMKDTPSYQSELVLSLDVLYHLVEDDVFHSYMTQLFDASTQFVVIYSCNFDTEAIVDDHVRERKFTNWITEHRKDFKEIDHIPNKFPYKEGEASSTSISDFYIYQRK